MDGLRKRQEGLRRKLEVLAAATGATGRAADEQKAELKQLLARAREILRQETRSTWPERLERLYGQGISRLRR